MAVLRLVCFYQYLLTYSFFWGFSIHSNSITAAFRHYLTVNNTLALSHFSWLLYKPFSLSQNIFSTNNNEKPGPNRKEIVISDNHGTQTRRSNCGRHTKRFSIGTLHYTQCPNFSKISKSRPLYFFSFLKLPLTFDPLFVDNSQVLKNN